jgi:ABC-2 type transport system permease protein
VTRVVRSELLKLRTARTYWGLLLAALFLLLLFLILSLALQHRFDKEDDVRQVLSNAGVGGLIMLVMGVVHSAGEYRHGTIASMLLTTPHRLRAMCGQALACALAGVAVGALMCVVTAAIALPWLAAKHATALPAAETLGLLGGNVLYAALAAALGSGLGATLRNQVVAVVLLLVLIFVIDPALGALVGDYAPYSLSSLSSSLSGSSPDPDEELLPLWEAALIWAGYTVVLVGAAAVLTSRRDI